MFEPENPPPQNEPPPDPEMERLANEASLIDAPALPPPPPPSDLEACSNEIAGLLLLLGSALSMRWPACAEIYSLKACRHHGAAIAPALIKLGWWSPGGDWGLYVAAGASVATLGISTYQVIMRDEKLVEAVDE